MAKLSPTDVARLRANMSRRLTQITNRMSAHALGELDSPMDATQIKAAEVLIKSVLPAQIAQQINHTSDDGPKSREEILALVERSRREVIKSLSAEEVQQIMRPVNEDSMNTNE